MRMLRRAHACYDGGIVIEQCQIAADTDGAARLRYVRSIFDPEASVRRPATLPTSYPQASHFSNFANLYNLRTTYGGDRPAAEASPGMPQEKWMVTQEA